MEKIKRRVAQRAQVRTQPLTLKVLALGGFSLRINRGEEVTKWPTAKCRELLAYMVFQSEGNLVSKWKLMDMLWPGKDEEKSAINLRSTVCRLNKSLRDLGIQGGLVAYKNNYRLAMGEYEVDAFLLERFIRYGDKSQVALQDLYHLYPGDLFKDLDYEWSTGLKSYYQRLFVSLGKDVVDARIQLNLNPLTTLQMLEYLDIVDFYNEEIQEQRLKVLYQLEGKAAVVRCQEAFENRLKDDIGVEPTDKLKKAYIKLVHDN